MSSKRQKDELDRRQGELLRQAEVRGFYNGQQSLAEHALSALSGAKDVSLAGSPSVQALMERLSAPIPMLLWCPECGERHIDMGEFGPISKGELGSLPETFKKHHTHACQHCGHCWRPAIVHTIGVQFLPGYKNDA